MSKQMTLGTGFEKYSKTTRHLCACELVPASTAAVATVGGVVCPQYAKRDAHGTVGLKRRSHAPVSL
ncbi:MAG: hypothetical protein ACREYF_11435 [Gammaproteobacteria bacterium]